MLGGILPTSVVNLSSNIQELYIGGNPFSGNIPSEIGNIHSLSVLTLENTGLKGIIPSTIGRLHNLQVLDLHGSRLTGKIPDSIGNLTKLLYLYLDQNMLNGSMPKNIGNCVGMLELYLSVNKLSGPIPKELFRLSSLAIFLDLSYNLFTGSLSLEVSNLKNLEKLDISNNQLAGEIPSTLGECQSLEYLYMQGNLFEGAIPSSLISLKGLRSLDLSHNKLTGEIPDFVEKLGVLQYLNLSFNNLSGEVPTQGIFRNITADCLIGNGKLCSGNPRLLLHQCKAVSVKKLSQRELMKILLLVTLTLCIFLVTSFVCYKIMKLRTRPSTNSPMEENFIRVSYGDILRATDEFSVSNLIGTGSFGSVYTGIMNAETVAIKVLNLQQPGASKSFITECESSRSLRHRNLVKIITSCSTLDYRGNDFKALVLKYMPNGCLENWLHKVGPETSATRPLTLIQRLTVAIDIASGIDYLHNHAPEPIIHCDLKSSNILLDEEMHAHVGDFGLARFIHKKASEIDEIDTRSLVIKGTIGYVPPGKKTFFINMYG